MVKYLDASEFRQLQLVQLGITDEVVRLCEQHGLSYFLMAGSALGARRHAGFIPWDDDMDIGMLRPVYDRFLAVAKRELPATLHVQDWRTDPHMGTPFTKIRRIGTRMVETSSKNVGGHKGIFIDIFPLDNVPDNPLALQWHLAHLALWKRLLRHRMGYTIKPVPGVAKMVDPIVRILSRVIPPAFVKHRLDRRMVRYANRSTRSALTVAGSYSFRKETLDIDWVTDVIDLPFEGRMYSCSRDLDGYLTHLYGDYMRLPPIEERSGKHPVVDIRFDGD